MRSTSARRFCLADASGFGMIGDARVTIHNAFSREAFMSASKVVEFAQTDRPMTYDEGLSFIERMRRQLDRFDVTKPGANGKRMDQETESKIRRLCDELEAEFHSDLGYI
jgi:hypothetical protein